MKKHSRGRPTTYREEYIDKIDEYLELCQDEWVAWTKSVSERGETLERIMMVDLPTIEGFAQFIETPLTTIDSWKYKNPDFSCALEKIKVEQKKRLINGGLSGTYNSTIAKLILSSNHGMKERIDGTSGDKPYNPVTQLFSNDLLPKNKRDNDENNSEK